jgi:hypothetical protein
VRLKPLGHLSDAANNLTNLAETPLARTSEGIWQIAEGVLWGSDWQLNANCTQTLNDWNI